jgi:hypothetical protein
MTKLLKVTKTVMPVVDDLQVTQAGIQNFLKILDSVSRFACTE